MEFMKKKRHEKIVEIIGEYPVGTQEELASLLEDNGFEVTQATVSRDIRELHLSKVPAAGGAQRYVLIHKDETRLGEKYIRVLRDGFISIDAAQNLIILKTVSGMAMAVAAAIDAMNLKEVVGSIAGDDTVMVVVRTTEEAKRLIDKIKTIV